MHYQDNSKDPQGVGETAAAATGEEIWPQKEGNRQDHGKAEAFCFTQSLQNWTVKQELVEFSNISVRRIQKLP
jgi:hypothetical protein